METSQEAQTRSPAEKVSQVANALIGKSEEVTNIMTKLDELQVMLQNTKKMEEKAKSTICVVSNRADGAAHSGYMNLYDPTQNPKSESSCTVCTLTDAKPDQVFTAVPPLVGPTDTLESLTSARIPQTEPLLPKEEPIISPDLAELNELYLQLKGALEDRQRFQSTILAMSPSHDRNSDARMEPMDAACIRSEKAVEALSKTVERLAAQVAAERLDTDLIADYGDRTELELMRKVHRKDGKVQKLQADLEAMTYRAQFLGEIVCKLWTASKLSHAYGPKDYLAQMFEKEPSWECLDANLFKMNNNMSQVVSGFNLNRNFPPLPQWNE